ncbi:RAD9, HUS1, RAD1-interacting nuclear orphan protein 1 [Galemys pyrenaicus]|uniref:RAD9, HUS1, RAD1-interacting nuclear orphan protein 1 n=1 Tax=Galemys pyrenaicus TaxID=202257 RepID=A0A8J5ZXQ3_GALPY|nr:RAD9, HUS1, RAD1-interacting nuclear orphan protein 1 [Galemys pyrenaicus]
MPPRKKQRGSAQKAQLLFHQPPLEGPKHHSRAPQRPITHTRQVPSKPIDRSTITSWVSPQFDTTAESWLSTYQKPCRRHQARHSNRKSTTSRFPHLTFETPQSSRSATIETPLIRECPTQPEQDTSGEPLVPLLSPLGCGELSAHELQSLPYVFIPPDIQTPESSTKDGPTPPDLRENILPARSLYTSTPKSPQSVPILAEDTPEEKYGIKVTWRRRRHLLTYLQEKGKLSKSQFLVKN